MGQTENSYMYGGTLVSEHQNRLRSLKIQENQNKIHEPSSTKLLREVNIVWSKYCYFTFYNIHPFQKFPFSSLLKDIREISNEIGTDFRPTWMLPLLGQMAKCISLKEIDTGGFLRTND